MIVGEEPEQLQKSMKTLGVMLRNKETHLDPQPLLKLCLSRYFGIPKGFVDAIVRQIPSPSQGAEIKIKHFYTGYQTSDIANDMRKCSSHSGAHLMANITKMYNTADGGKFWALARIYSGTIEKGQKVRVLGKLKTCSNVIGTLCSKIIESLNDHSVHYAYICLSLLPWVD